MHLASAAQSRDNNFNLLRLVAALVVVLSHSYPLIWGHNGREPLFRLVGMTMGLVAVDAFFVISGFLNTQSLISREHPGRFALARALRIFPALWVMVIVSVLVVGLAFSDMPAGQFFRHPQTQAYVWKNGTLFFGAEYELPAFSQLPYPFVANGSLWSLPLELRMYVGLLLVYLIIKAVVRHKSHMVRKAVLPLIAMLAGLYFVWARPRGAPWVLEARLLCLFAQGAAYAVWQDKIELRTWALSALILIVGASAWWWTTVFYPIYVAGFAYALLCLAYLPNGWIRGFNRWGDVSYGIYIYAFPIQQAVVVLFEPRSAVALTMIAIPFIVLMATLSWRLIEKPALRLKSHPRFGAISAGVPPPRH